MAFMRHLVICLLFLTPAYALASQDSSRIDNAATASSTATDHKITLTGVLFKSQEDWLVWLNGKKITQDKTTWPPQLIDIEVRKDGTTRLKWFDAGLNGVIDVTVGPHNNYDIESGDIKQTPIEAPKGMTLEEWNWVQNAVIQPFNFSYTNYQRQLHNASKKFNKNGWDRFTRQLQENHFLDNIQSGKLTVFSIISAKPMVIEQGLLKGLESWTFKIPMALKYTDGRETRTDNITFIITIVRDPQNPAGLAIENWDFEKANMR